MKEDILFNDGNYAIKRYHGIPDEAIAFLDNIAWGNEGALYEHRNTEEHIKLLHKPILVGLFEREQLKATGVFSITHVTVGSQLFNCNYFRYFASSKEIQGKGIIKKLTIKVMQLLNDMEQEKTIFFACVEKENKSSYHICKSAGYTPVGTIKTIGFSRFWPRFNKDIEKISSAKEKEEVISLLKKLYAQHALVQFNSLFLNDNYFVIRENNQIVAGCQYHRVHWVINNMKGFSGKIIMNIIPLIPILNKIFNPKRFEFLAFEGIYFKPGYEHKLYSLFEGLLQREKLKSSMLWMGKNCPVRKKIMVNGKLGLIHTFIKDSDVEVMASFKNMSESEISNVKTSPIFASAFDYI